MPVMSARLPPDASIPSRFPPGFRGERAPCERQRQTTTTATGCARICSVSSVASGSEAGASPGRAGERAAGGPRAPPTARCRTASVAELVGGVERGDLVALGERRVVEDRLQEVVDPAPQPEHRLPDVDQLRRAGADGVDAQEPPILPVKEHLEQAGVVQWYARSHGNERARDDCTDLSP